MFAGAGGRQYNHPSLFFACFVRGISASKTGKYFVFGWKSDQSLWSGSSYNLSRVLIGFDGLNTSQKMILTPRPFTTLPTDAG